jgi:hypothetical protein
MTINLIFGFSVLIQILKANSVSLKFELIYLVFRDFTIG